MLAKITEVDPPMGYSFGDILVVSLLKDLVAIPNYPGARDYVVRITTEKGEDTLAWPCEIERIATPIEQMEAKLLGL